jgi:SAM-dependent methyltransferase
MYSDLKCPKCQSKLVAATTCLLCSGCSREWPIHEGIPSFMEGSYPYWGFVPKERFQEVWEIACSEGWRNGIAHAIKISKKHPEHAWTYLTSENRSLFKYLLGLAPETRVLEVGSGWGPIALDLARDSSLVFAMDPTLENLRFLALRARQEGIDNLFPVNVGLSDHPYLPFLNEYFDVAILSGVLEWIGAGPDTSLDPIALQKDGLKKIFSVLKTGGRLYIGTENRLGFKYFLGQKDEHSGLRFATLMPRTLANLYSRVLKQREYRTYTHSHNGLEKLLKKVGFNRLQFFSILPNYSSPRFIIPHKNPSIWRFFLDYFARYSVRMNLPLYLLVRLTIHLNIYKHFVPTLAVIAEK